MGAASVSKDVESAVQLQWLLWARVGCAETKLLDALWTICFPQGDCRRVLRGQDGYTMIFD